MDRNSMERHACHVIYVNRDAGEDRIVRAAPTPVSGPPDQVLDSEDRDTLRDDIQPLLDAFGDVHICATGMSCISKLLELQDKSTMDMRPMIVLLDTPDDQPIPDPRRLSRSPSPCSPSLRATAANEIHTPEEDIYGLDLLQKLITEARMRNMSKLVVPVPLIRHPQAPSIGTKEQMTDGAVEPFTAPLGTLDAHRRLVRRCLDLGAVDVIISPLTSNCITALEICAYKAHRDASREQQDLMEIRRGRKRSWVGVNEEKPFSYLREAMVSGLMNGICRLSPEEDQITSFHIAVSTERQNVIAEAVGQWHFDAHSFTDDELLVAAMVMFKHALAMPELETWRLPADQLITFLVACRTAYNNFVPYHNFRHVVDVLQATFNFLVHINAFPPYPYHLDSAASEPKSPIAALLSPFEALTLLITAIGHDVGHPGVNNGFLSTLNAPLAQLYNDRSVLESFHCAAYTQILRRYWPAVFEDRKMRSLMISSILATDMGLHFDYMKKLGDVQEKLQDNNTTDGWNGRLIEEQKALACSLLIKCADISNVARHFDTALQWMHILSEEFSRQASMEEELEIKSSLLAPPKKDLLSLINSQLGFMNIFAIPLFQGVADIMPGMQYTVDELETNKGRFEMMVQQEKAKALKEDPQLRRLRKEGTYSPRTMSFAVDPNSASSKGPSIPMFDQSGQAIGIAAQSQGPAPTALLDVKRADEHLEESALSHNTVEYKEMNGTVSSFEAVRELAESDPFYSHDQSDGHADSKSGPPGVSQRRSETTEGSTTGAGAGDWASQATSATTGKMPVSPSTRGTSIVSHESMERNGSVPGLSVSRPSTDGSPSTVKRDGVYGDEESTSTNGSIGKAEGKTLKKKPSWFRMKDLPFFRRHKGSTSPFSASDTTG